MHRWRLLSKAEHNCRKGACYDDPRGQRRRTRKSNTQNQRKYQIILTNSAKRGFHNNIYKLRKVAFCAVVVYLSVYSSPCKSSINYYLPYLYSKGRYKQSLSQILTKIIYSGRGWMPMANSPV